MALDKLNVPTWGEPIDWDGSSIKVPDKPVIPFIAGAEFVEKLSLQMLGQFSRYLKLVITRAVG